MFFCYNNGIEWLNIILYQDVYQIESRNIKGHHACNIVSYKLQDLQVVKKNNKEKKKQRQNQIMIIIIIIITIIINIMKKVQLLKNIEK